MEKALQVAHVAMRWPDSYFAVPINEEIDLVPGLQSQGLTAPFSAG